MENKNNLDWWYLASEKYFRQWKIMQGEKTVIVDGLYYEKLTREICDAHNKTLTEVTV